MIDGQKTIFLDRDGTLVDEVNYLSRIEDLRLFPFSCQAMQILRSAGFQIIVVTNQSGIGRAIFDEMSMHSIHDAINQELSGAIDRFYFCPHVPGENCKCRKPGTGMVEAAQKDLNIKMKDSWMIGDKVIDVETGFNAGLSTAMVMTGYGSAELDLLERRPTIIAANVLEAAREIIKRC